MNKKNLISSQLVERMVWAGLFVAALLPFLLSLGITLIAPDSAVYAVISKTMVTEQEYWRLYKGGTDWLDKPHFQFWMTALGYQIMGINELGYRLPGFLFTLLGIGYTYLLGKELYNPKIGLYAAFLFCTALHTLIGFIDLRAEIYLAGLIIASVYHLVKVKKGSSYWIIHLLAGALFAAAAAMTKGIFVWITIGSTILGEILLKRQWKELLNPKWYLGIFLVLVFITPELYALYIQFDAEPDKVVFDTTGVSGIRFFLWDSQWGRFANTGPIKGQGDFLFFFHTVLWAFLPWSVLWYAGIIKRFRKNIPRIQYQQEFFTLSGALLTFFLFASSSFQLSHYLTILFPFFAILTAAYVAQVQSPRGVRWMRAIQYSLLALGVIAIVGVHLIFAPEQTPIAFWLLAGLMVLGGWLVPYASFFTQQEQILVRSALGYLVLYFYLALVFYPNLLHYQAEDKAAAFMNTHWPGTTVSLYDYPSSDFEFYINAPVLRDSLPTLAGSMRKNGSMFFFTNEPGRTALDTAGYQMEEINRFSDFPVTKINFKFFNHKTRKEALSNLYLLRLEDQE